MDEALSGGPISANPVNPVWRGLKDVAFGSTAGIISKIFEHPFDLCKVRLQSQVMDQHARFSGPIDCLRQTYTNEGIRGLYRGLPAPIVGAMAENASLFLTYNELQNVIRRWNGYEYGAPLSLKQLMLAAAGAGGIASFLLTPIELVKCKMQVQMLAHLPPAASVLSPEAQRRAQVQALIHASATGATLPHPVSQQTSVQAPSFKTLDGPWSIIRRTVAQHGIKGLWLGQTGTFIRETGGGAAWFGTNEAVSSLLLDRLARRESLPRSGLSKKDLRWYELAFAGACSGIMFNFVLFPADSVKSAVQTEEELRGNKGKGKGPGIGEMAIRMWRKEGIRGFYAGCGVTVARAAPSNALIFLIYDTLSAKFA
ncbi:hypothetical protein Clacol_004671 [Clathrus columnatus]|uniref:Mitochondrial carrier n=1 Tax=Clathrus columnatus TaxID=1419009 RepID=A0AAV5AC00_9AGAM|nr:hypothetical protein Clacol_004671 [Clathrus columnatus]